MKALVHQLNVLTTWQTMNVKPTNLVNSLSLVGSPNAVAGLIGLEIEGKRYKVFFVQGNYDQIYQHKRPLFLDNLVGAKAAAEALVAALNQLGVKKLAGGGEYVNIPCQLTTHTYEEMYLEKEGNQWSAEHFVDFSTTPSTYYLEVQRNKELYTRFSPL